MQQISAEVIYELEKLLFERPHFRSEKTEHEEADFVDRNSEGAFCCFGVWVLFLGEEVFLNNKR